MARYLAIDWNPPQLHVLAVDSAKGHAKAMQALAVSLDEDLTPAKPPSRVGQESCATPSRRPGHRRAPPPLWTIGRDRIVLKELTIPLAAPERRAGDRSLPGREGVDRADGRRGHRLHLRRPAAAGSAAEGAGRSRPQDGDPGDRRCVLRDCGPEGEGDRAARVRGQWPPCRGKAARPLRRSRRSCCPTGAGRSSLSSAGADLAWERVPSRRPPT